MCLLLSLHHGLLESLPKMKKLLLLLLLPACATQPVVFQDSFEVYGTYVEPEVKTVIIESLRCKEAVKVNKYRNAKIHERMDECMEEVNDYIKCSHWVFGYIGEH